MTQNASDVEIANQGFAAFRQDLNDVLEDITTLHSGDTAPTTTYANQFWYETDTDKLYIRNEDNDAWIEILTLDQANDHLATIGASITLDGTGNVSIDSGDFTVDTSTLHVDSTNNKVGIGTTSPNTAYSAPAIHIHSPSANGAMLHLTDTTTGATSTDGMSIFQYGADGYINMRENGNLRTYVNGSERMTIDSSGNVLVGKTSSSSVTEGAEFRQDGRLGITSVSDIAAYFNRTGTNGDVVRFIKLNTTVGSISVTGSSTSYNTSSDYRLKENVTGITDGIERVKQLNPSRFNFIADADRTVDGFLAHEAQTVVPEAVTGEKDAMRDEEYEVTPAVLDDDGNVVTEAVMGTRSVPDYQGIDQAKLVPLLTAALQEAITKIEALETENADFETRIAALEAN